MTPRPRRRLTSTPTPGGVRTGAAGMPQVRNQAGVSGIVFGACLMGGWAVLFLVDPGAGMELHWSDLEGVEQAGRRERIERRERR